jgi:hypothetical protein
MGLWKRNEEIVLKMLKMMMRDDRACEKRSLYS